MFSYHTTETKAVDEKLNSKKILEFPSLHLCTSARDVETESDIDHMDR